MQTVTRNQLKTLFKKVKHLRLPPNLEEMDFENIFYLGWIDESEDTCFLVTEIDGELQGIRGEINRMPRRVSMKHQCTICRQGREFEEIMLFTARNRRLPKGVDYRVTGVYICKDPIQCNADMKDSMEIEKYISRILYN